MDVRLAKIDNVADVKGTEKLCEAKKPHLWKALDTIVGELNITFGTIKIYIHEGRWNPRLEIQNNLFKDIKRD